MLIRKTQNQLEQEKKSRNERAKARSRRRELYNAYKAENKNRTLSESNRIKKNDLSDDLRLMSKLVTQRIINTFSGSAKRGTKTQIFERRFSDLNHIIFRTLNYVLEVQHTKFGSVNFNSKAKAMYCKSMAVEIKSDEELYAFMMTLFCDFLHDFKDNHRLYNILQVEMSDAVMERPRSERVARGEAPREKNKPAVNLFKAWIQNAKWVHPKIKEEILEKEFPEFEKILEVVVGKKTHINESLYQCMLMEYYTKKITKMNTNNTKMNTNKNNKNGSFNNFPIKKMNTSDINEKSLLGGPNHYIAFDQTSKGSSLKIIGKLQKSDDNSHKYDISLPLMGDKGVGMSTHQLNSFYNIMKGICRDILSLRIIDSAWSVNNKLSKEVFVNTSRNAKTRNIENRLYQNLKKLTEMYIINFNKSYTVDVLYNNTPVMSYKYHIGKQLDEDWDILVSMKSWIKIRNNKGKEQVQNGTINNKIRSAGDIQNMSNINLKNGLGIFKTLGDLNIMIYAINANSIACTGDRMAGSMYMQLFLGFNNNEIIFINPQFPKARPLPRFIYEHTNEEVICATQLRSNQSTVDLFPNVKKRNIDLCESIFSVSKWNSKMVDNNKLTYKKFNTQFESTGSAQTSSYHSGGPNRTKRNKPANKPYARR